MCLENIYTQLLKMVNGRHIICNFHCLVMFDLWTVLRYYFCNLQYGFKKSFLLFLLFFQNIHQIVVYAATVEWLS